MTSCKRKFAREQMLKKRKSAKTARRLIEKVFASMPGACSECAEPLNVEEHPERMNEWKVKVDGDVITLLCPACVPTSDPMMASALEAAQV